MQQPENNPQPNALPPKITKEVILQSQTDKKAQVAYWLKTVLYLLASSFLISFAAYSLITPNKFTIGGASGISILVNVASGGAIPQSVMLFAINAPPRRFGVFLHQEKIRLFIDCKYRFANALAYSFRACLARFQNCI